MLKLIFSNFYSELNKKLDNQNIRDEFIISELKKLTQFSTILDAGCGNQPYKKFCAHLKYFGQDFGQYETDESETLLGDGVGGKNGYLYGKLDYIGNIWEIDAESQSFDTILCSEVFEHIPYPIETIKEFSRLLKNQGKLILTAPSNCLRHMDPYFFYTGFSDRWFKKILEENDFIIEGITPIGDYYSWISVEIWRSMRSMNFFQKLIMYPAFLFFYRMKANDQSISTLCMGYHITAIKK